VLSDRRGYDETVSSASRFVDRWARGPFMQCAPVSKIADGLEGSHLPGDGQQGSFI
jgi:hypothetical protein